MLVQTIIQSDPGAINQSDVARLVAVFIIGIACYISTIRIIKSNFGNAKILFLGATILYGTIIFKICMIFFQILFH
jgi:hypothetical protein